MKTLVIGVNPIFFGMCETETLPVLPPGFYYVKNPNCWLVATDGSRNYYVRKSSLVRQREADIRDQGRTNGRLKVGQYFIDDTDVIPL